MDLTSWQAQLPDSLPISLMNIPGTHDSSTQFINLSPFSRCQNKSIREQLEMGIRFLDIRLFLNGSRFYAVHGAANCRTAKKHRSPLLSFNEIIKELKDFVNNHPMEAVVVLLNVGRGSNGDDFFNAFHEQFIEPDTVIWFLENRIPLLGECRGKLVLLRRCNLGKPGKPFTDQSTGINFTNMGQQGSTKDFRPLPCPFEQLSDKPWVQSAVIQDRYMFNPIAKWKKAVKHALDNAEPDNNTIYMHYLSTAGPPFVPYFNSKYINSKFRDYDLTNKKAYGWVIIDFPSEELIKKIAESNSEQ